ncbi:MAG TPA: DUF1329 domain-containing protein [Gammaproteobacteria bacterium]|nr:DUF1329 domain-containing protein [Gammaproteobacteria bacterium]
MTRMNRYLALGSAAVLMAIAVAASAKVSRSKADALGKSLTPVGAKKAGSKNGVIPAWHGGHPKASRPPEPHFLNNPYKNDKKRFTITHGNYKKYAKHLTPGEIALLKQYKGFRMNVYPTHRPASYPKQVYKWTRYNALHATLKGQNGVRHAAIGFPYPIPGNGAQAMWNHSLGWHYPHSVLEHYDKAIVSQSGSFYRVGLNIRLKFVYNNLKSTPKKVAQMNPPMYVYFLQHVNSPARLAGQVLLVWEPINQKAHKRSAWIYNPGQRRVRRAPNVAFDNTTGTHSDGLQTDDQFNMWNGSLEQYNWKLLGRKKIYIPYDSYKLEQHDVKPHQLIQAHHLNPKYLRYELHRVWVVKATLKSGIRDIYSKRVFYLDEDSWQAAVVDCYDKRGNLWRVQQGYLKDYYDIPETGYALTSINDLSSGRYIVSNLDNEHGPARPEKYSKSKFAPSSLRRMGVR